MTTTDVNGMARVLASIPEGELPDPSKYTTSLGVVLRIRPVPPLLLQDARKHIPVPTPPRVFIQDKDTHEENLSDPDYLRAMQEYEAATGESANALLLTRGTDVEYVPPGVEPVDSTNWSDDVADFTGIDVPREGRRRYYCWMKYVAIATQDDFMGILSAVSRASGLTREADVADAIERFPDNEARDTVTGPALAANVG